MLEYGDDDSDGHDGDDSRSKNVILPDSNKSIIDCVHCGKQQVVDLSTGAVCRIEEFGPIKVIRDDRGGQEVFCLSPDHAEYLGLASGAVDVDEVKQLMTDRKSEVEKFLKKVSIATRFVIIAVDHERS